MKRGLVIVLVIALVGASVGFFHSEALAKKKPQMKDAAAPDVIEMELQDLLAPKLKDEMHFIIEAYLQAGINYSYGKYDNAILHLKVMEYYIGFLPGLMPTANLDGTPMNKDEFTANVTALKDMTIRLRTLIEKKKYDEIDKIGIERVVDVCMMCHETVKVPENAWDAAQ